MPYLAAFGKALPERIVTNEELALRLGCTTDWILNACGIEQRRHVGEGMTLAGLAAEAGRACLYAANHSPSQIGMVIVSSGSSPRRFPGPAAEVASRLAIAEAPAIDLPLASAGSLFALALAADLVSVYGPILVIAAEVMSPFSLREPLDRNSAILFGDGAGAALVHPSHGLARIKGSLLASDGSYAGDLSLDWSGTFTMNGRSVIIQATRKIPRIIRRLLEKHSVRPDQVDVYLLHQANQNLLNRVAEDLEISGDRVFSNIRLYGNTSSASLLIAAQEWFAQAGSRSGQHVCFSTFGAGFQWGALLAETGSV